MLVTIGLMIGFYIIARMVSFLGRTGERSEPPVSKVFAVVSILVTLICLFDLLVRGTTPNGL